MDHYFSSIAKHLSNGGGANGENGANTMNNNNNMNSMNSMSSMGAMGGMGAMVGQGGDANRNSFVNAGGGNLQQPSPSITPNLPGSRVGSAGPSNCNTNHNAPGNMPQNQNIGNMQQQGMSLSSGQFESLQQQMGNASRHSFASQSSQVQRSSSASINNPYTSKALLEMLDEDIVETSGQSNQKNKDMSQDLNGGQQSQMMMANMMKQQMQQQQNFQQQVQRQMQGGHGQMHGQGGQGQMQGQGGQGQMQGGHGQMQGQGGQMQLNQRQMQGHQGQMQGNQSKMQGNPGQGGQSHSGMQLTSQQKQIQEFIQRHGHNLTPQQRANLQQQLANMTQGSNNMSSDSNATGANVNANQGHGVGASMSAGGNGNSLNSSSNQTSASGGGGGVMSMDDLMIRQREQLRHLQSMLKNQNPPEDQSQEMRGMNQSEQQQMQQAAMNMHSQSQNSQMNQNMQMNQHMNQQQKLNNQQQMNQNNIQMNQQQQQKIQQMSQHSSTVMQQMIQQRQMQANASQQQQMQNQQMSMQPQDQRSGMMRRSGFSQTNNHSGNQSTSPMLSQSSSPPLSKVSSSDPAPVPSAATSSMAHSKIGSASGGTTRVVPVSVSPISSCLEPADHGSGISEAALIYTKHALESIISSLNTSSSKGETKDSSKTGKVNSGRIYTIRDLSTCLGAWDLNIPSSPGAKRMKFDDGASTEPGDGNADTAFNFYHERWCPILLDANHSAGIFSVEDFSGGGNPSVGNLPAVTGAIVLTYGADSKFTGGIGEEGVLTKIIIEFFYDPIVAIENSDGVDNSGEDALLEAEERIFARVDSETSTLIKAALHSLSPSSSVSDASSSSDNGVYIPSIWSGNTNRVYQYCLLGNFDEAGKERASKRLCVAIKKKSKEGDCEKGPAQGVCRITLTLSPASVLSKKKQMSMEKERKDDPLVLAATASAVHKKIRHSLRTLRPPKLTSALSPSKGFDESSDRRRRLRRTSIAQRIDPSLIVVGIRCKHELLLDKVEAGKIYINGALVADCSSIPGSKEKSQTKEGAASVLGSDSLPAHTLFGVDFTFSHSNPVIFFSALPGREVLEVEYGSLIMDALVFAGQCDADVAGKLLHRLITGRTEDNLDGFDDEALDRDETQKRSASHSFGGEDDEQLVQMDSSSSKIEFDNTSFPTLESLVLSSSAVDPVGIGAKALGTKFGMQYGRDSWPCELNSDEARFLRKVLGAHKVPKLVPRRARDVLRRGGYLNLGDMATFTWGGGASSWDGNHDDSMRAAEAMEGAMKLLRKAGCRDVKPNKIRFVARKQLEPVNHNDGDNSIVSSSQTPPVSKLRCWWDHKTETYYVSDAILFAEENEDGEDSVCSGSTAGQSFSSAKESKMKDPQEKTLSSSEVASGSPEKSIGSRKNLEDDLSCGKDLFGEDSHDKAGEECSEEKKNELESDKTSCPNTSNNQDFSSGSNSNELKQGSETKQEHSKKLADSKVTEDKEKKRLKPIPSRDAAYLLGFYIAREHPDPLILERYIMRCRA